MPKKRTALARVTFRLTDAQLRELDETVKKGRFKDRSEAARAAIDRFLAKKLEGLETRKKLLELLKKAKKR